MKNNLLPIANEGWSYIGYSIGFLLIFSILNLVFLQLLLFAIVVFFIFVFRNPERELPSFDANSVLCPADGEVISIDTLSDAKYAYKVTIDAGYKNVGVLRAPMNASLVSVKQKHGTRLSLKTPMAMDINESVNMLFEDSNNNKIQIIHTVKQSLCGVVVDVKENQSLTQSARYGIMVNGITQIYLPQNFRLNIALGEEVVASKSLVGYFS